MATQTDHPDRHALRTGGHAWGPLRIAFGISMRDLERLSGIGRAQLSFAESGRYVPTGNEFTRVYYALRQRDPELRDRVDGAPVEAGQRTETGPQ